jgi:UDP-GlcNAc:undecaprenyl-phosphate GlcNAc-1-phosphate transferase
MTSAVLLLALLAFAIACPATWLVRAASLRVRALDTAPIPGQTKFAPRRVPNTGGIAVFAAVALPILVGVLVLRDQPSDTDLSGQLSLWLMGRFPSLSAHAAGIVSQSRLALTLVGCLAWLHVLGLFDDRRPLKPILKLVLMAVPASIISIVEFPFTTETRLLTALDVHVGGSWLSILITVIWFLTVTNAMNFMDNMDGLAGGVATIAGACFLASTLIHGQWFVSACLALLIGASLGFLVFNFPWRSGRGERRTANGEQDSDRHNVWGRSASIFLGDGGSLVVGFLLAFLTARATYYFSPEAGQPSSTARNSGGGWYSVLMPLIVLAVPLYDFVAVTLIRLARGRSPFVGDLNHLSHRLVRRGLSKRAAVVVICLFALATGLIGIPFPSLLPWQALLVGIQVVALLTTLGVFEWAEMRTSGAAGLGDSTK